jgi:hypothetical protein
MLYFLVHDAAVFRDRIAPALATSWRQRAFGPLRSLAADLAPTFAAFADRYRLTADEQPLLARLTPDQPFDRRLWRHLAGEVLLYAAADAPAVQTDPETLTALVAADQRETIRQAHAGSRDLDFDGISYRPGHAGWNDSADVARLAAEFAAIDPAAWVPISLTGDDPAEELAFASAAFASLREIYDRARDCNQVVICEDI